MVWNAEITEVVEVIVGDFLEVGLDQILLFHPPKLQNSGKLSKKDNFTLTDLRRTWPQTKGQGSSPLLCNNGSHMLIALLVPDIAQHSPSLQWVAYSLHCRLREGQQLLQTGRERVRRWSSHAVAYVGKLSLLSPLEFSSGSRSYCSTTPFKC